MSSSSYRYTTLTTASIAIFCMLLQTSFWKNQSGTTKNQETNQGQVREEISHVVSPGPDYFAKLLKAYLIIKTNSTDPHDEKIRQTVMEQNSNATTTQYYATGALVPFEIRDTGTHGRGIFVTRPVAKGQRVWRSHLYGIYRTRQEWYSFLDILEPLEDYLEPLHDWAYVMEDGEEDEDDDEVPCDEDGDEGCVNWGEDDEDDDDEDDEDLVVGLDLDESSILNHGGTADIDEVEEMVNQPSNIYQVYDEKEEAMYYVALRDIVADEELLCDYTHFHDYENDDELDWWDVDEYKKYRNGQSSTSSSADIKT
mmetsp:Transcript_28817/g.79106  ORF Transcript_28817/g.79106 Transcript_28817/m.79106 type:complete len:311 (-) Transcript_28817:707-1639(-)